MAKKKTKEDVDHFRDLIKESMRNHHAKRINRMMEEADDKMFWEMYKTLLPYTQPQLQKTENKNTNDNEIKINVDWNSELPKYLDSGTASESEEDIK